MRLKNSTLTITLSLSSHKGTSQPRLGIIVSAPPLFQKRKPMLHIWNLGLSYNFSPQAYNRLLAVRKRDWYPREIGIWEAWRRGNPVTCVVFELAAIECNLPINEILRRILKIPMVGWHHIPISGVMPFLNRDRDKSTEILVTNLELNPIYG